MVSEPGSEPSSSVPGLDSQAGQRSKLGRVGTSSLPVPRPRCGERLLQSQGPLEMPGWP